MATFFNQATLSYNDTIIDSNIVTGELLEVLSATKTALPSTYESGDSITYVVSIVNAGSNALTDLTVTDNLGAYTFNTQTLVPLTYESGSVRYYSNGVLQPAPTVADTNPLTITGLSVPANGNVLLVYQASVNQFAPLSLESTITNVAVISGDCRHGNANLLPFCKCRCCKYSYNRHHRLRHYYSRFRIGLNHQQIHLPRYSG